MSVDSFDRGTRNCLKRGPLDQTHRHGAATQAAMRSAKLELSNLDYFAIGPTRTSRHVCFHAAVGGEADISARCAHPAYERPTLAGVEGCSTRRRRALRRARFVAQRHVVPIGLAARLANADPLRSSGHNPHAARAFSEQIAFGSGAAGG